jgi:phage tail tape-measure protein
MINDIEDSGEFEISDDMVSSLSSDIAEALENEGMDIVDDYELSMNYKEVELDSIDLNESKIKAAVKDALESYIANNALNS